MIKCKSFFCEGYYKDGRHNCQYVTSTVESLSFKCSKRKSFDNFWRWLNTLDYEIQIPVKVKLESLKKQLEEIND